eukprot:705805-Rhodomonas_salina.1
MPGCLSWRSLRGGGVDVEERRGLRMQCQKSEGAGSRGVGLPAGRRACPEEGSERAKGRAGGARETGGACVNFSRVIRIMRTGGNM